MVTRRQFLGMSVAGMGTVALPRWAMGWGGTRTLEATCYYPKSLKVLPGRPRRRTYRGWSDRLVVRTESGPWTLHVDPREHYLAAIEASARVDLAAVGVPAELGISWYGGRWHAHPWAPYGVGDRLNPLIPGRDFAQGYRSGWPFGTRLELRAPVKLAQIVRPVMYRGCRFGGRRADRRIDLFVAEPSNFYGFVRGRVHYPWASVSARPTKGAQQCLNILHITDAEGRRLRTENIWGTNTQHALEVFLNRYARLFEWGVPEYKVPWDSEIYYLLREAARSARTR